MALTNAKHALALLTLSACTHGASAQSFDVSWYTIDAGGGTSSGGPFTLRATIGQPDASGPLTGGAFTLRPGFWPGALRGPSCAADVNGDGVLDLGDIQAFVALFLAGDPGADFNPDGVLDNGDIQAFVTAFLEAC
ncbi:MAG: GC-type dockerin domain-anchored protein [Phycisphaerales bacterium JB040]